MTKKEDLIRILKQHGFEKAGGAGHDKYKHPDGRQTSVPRHNEIKYPTAVKVLKDAGLDKSLLRGLK